jgi:hypothetical protein
MAAMLGGYQSIIMDWHTEAVLDEQNSRIGPENLEHHQA